MTRIEIFAQAFQKKYYQGLCEDKAMVRMLSEELTAKIDWLTGSDGISTREAFLELISERGIHKKLEIKSTAIRVFRHEIKTGKWPKEETMFEYLQKAGYKMVSDRKWGKM